jgi:hypothetical protein
MLAGHGQKPIVGRGPIPGGGCLGISGMPLKMPGAGLPVLQFDDCGCGDHCEFSSAREGRFGVQALW